jgi:hypothetical protein
LPGLIRTIDPPFVVELSRSIGHAGATHRKATRPMVKSTKRGAGSPTPPKDAQAKAKAAASETQANSVKRAGSAARRGQAPKASAVSDEVMAFKSLVDEFRYPMSPQPKALTNVTFFVGAGFSKAWDPSAPVGSTLFTLPASLIDDIIGPDVQLRQFGIGTDPLEPNDLRQIVYQLDMYDRYPDIRPRYIDAQNIPMMRAALRAAVVSQYSGLATLSRFDAETGKFLLPPEMTTQQEAILKMFIHLSRLSDGSQTFAEGLRANFVTTNYDFVIETILDNVLDVEDSLFLYTYRGFTPTGISDHANPKPAHEHWIGSHLIKLNGGFEILRAGAGYTLDYKARTDHEIRERPPIIMLPSREQDYSDPYFAAIFPKAVRLMRDSRVLVLVGYSIPDDDALMRFVIRQFAEEPEDGRWKSIFYIDPVLTPLQMRAKLETVFPTMGPFGTPSLFAFHGSFADFASQFVSMLKEEDFF